MAAVNPTYHDVLGKIAGHTFPPVTISGGDSGMSFHLWLRPQDGWVCHSATVPWAAQHRCMCFWRRSASINPFLSPCTPTKPQPSHLHCQSTYIYYSTRHERIKEGQTNLRHVTPMDNVADVFTKALHTNIAVNYGLMTPGGVLR